MIEPLPVNQESDSDARQIRDNQPFLSSELPGFIRERHAVIIGVNSYKSSRMTELKYCVSDAIAIESALKKCKYDPRLILLMHTGENETSDRFPTEINIGRAITKKLIEIDRNDLLLVYFAGHGVPINEAGDAYLAASDFDPERGNEKMRLSYLRAFFQGQKFGELQMDEKFSDLFHGRSTDDLRESLTKRVILIIDACHVGPDLGRSNVEDFGIKGDTIDFAHGFVQISASTRNQKAYEHAGHGIFTYYVCQKFNDYQATSQNGTAKTLKVSDLIDSVYRQVHLWTRTNNYPFQWPSEQTIGVGDMDLADLRSQLNASRGLDKVQELHNRYKVAQQDLEEVPEDLRPKLRDKLTWVERYFGYFEDPGMIQERATNLNKVEKFLSQFERLFIRYRCQSMQWAKLLEVSTIYSLAIENEVKATIRNVSNRFTKALQRRLNYALNRIFDFELVSSMAIEELARLDTKKYLDELLAVRRLFEDLCEFKRRMEGLEILNDWLDPEYDLHSQNISAYIKRFQELTPSDWDDTELVNLLGDMDSEAARIVSSPKLIGKELPKLPEKIGELPLVPF